MQAALLLPAAASTSLALFEAPALQRYRKDQLFHKISSHPGLELQCADPFIFTLDNFLSADEADELIRLASHVPEAKSSEKLFQRGDRTSSSVVLHNDDVAPIRTRIADLAKVSLAQMQPLKFTRYSAGGVFRRHTDCTEAMREQPAAASSATDSTAPSVQFPNRFCTVLVYLNDCTSGGRTCFRWLDDDPLFYARLRARQHSAERDLPQWAAVLHENAQVAAARLAFLGRREGAAQQRRELCIKPKKGMAVVHFPCTSPDAGLVPDFNADHESEPAVDPKFVLQQFIWSSPMDSEDVDPRLRAKFEAF